MRMLVVTDPVEGLHPASDTTVAVVEAARAAGWSVARCGAGDLAIGADGRAWAREQPVVEASRHCVAVGDATEHRLLEEVDVVFVRLDPPFDGDYLLLTQILEHARGRTLVVNDPAGLRDANEKLYALRFPDLIPPTCVTTDRATVEAMAIEHGAVVLKPLDGHGGRGIVLLHAGDPWPADTVAALSRRGRRPFVVQAYLPAIAEGDRRILVLDGDPLGVVVRVPPPGGLLANLGAGGTARRGRLTDSDRDVVARVAPSLGRDGLWFVGIDVIGGCLTEVNVTSPTGLRHLADLDGGDPAAEVVRRLAGRVRHPDLVHATIDWRPLCPSPSPRTTQSTALGARTSPAR